MPMLSATSRTRGSPRSVGSVLDTDVLVPQLRFGFDELLHQSDAFSVLKDLQAYSPRADIVFRPLESLVFTDHDSGDPVEQRRSATHVARRERGIQHGTLVVLGC